MVNEPITTFTPAAMPRPSGVAYQTVTDANTITVSPRPTRG